MIWAMVIAVAMSGNKVGMTTMPYSSLQACENDVTAHISPNVRVICTLVPSRLIGRAAIIEDWK
jgi:hypothetical protein